MADQISLIPGSHLKDEEGDKVCYLPIFSSKGNFPDDTWIAGN